MTKQLNKADRDLMLAVLAHARLDLGVHEVRGKGIAPRIQEMLNVTGNGDIHNDEDSWCAVAHGAWQAEKGNPIPDPKQNNRSGLAYETWGKPLDMPELGCTCVSTYTKLGRKDWRRHVALVQEIDIPNRRVRLTGGNQSDAVTDKVWKSFDTVTAWRCPVPPTKKALLRAGSEEMLTAKALKNIAVGVGGTATTAATVQAATDPATHVATIASAAPQLPPLEVLAPSAADPSLLDTARQAGEGLGIMQTLGDGFAQIGTMITTHVWIVPVILGCGALWYVGHRIEWKRVQKHLAGLPLSKTLLEIVT